MKRTIALLTILMLLWAVFTPTTGVTQSVQWLRQWAIATFQNMADLADSNFVHGPPTSTNNNIPRYNGTTGTLLQDGIGFTTTVGTPGSDLNATSEQGQREALDLKQDKTALADSLANYGMSIDASGEAITQPDSILFGVVGDGRYIADDDDLNAVVIGSR